MRQPDFLVYFIIFFPSILVVLLFLTVQYINLLRWYKRWRWLRYRIQMGTAEVDTLFDEIKRHYYSDHREERQ